MELDWDNEYDTSSSKLLTLLVTFQPDGNYLIEVLKVCVKEWFNGQLLYLNYQVQSCTFS